MVKLLEVAFDDGVSGVVDLSGLVGKGIFAEMVSQLLPCLCRTPDIRRYPVYRLPVDGCQHAFTAVHGYSALMKKSGSLNSGFGYV